MKTIINWQDVNINLPENNDKILINTEYCRLKIDIGYYDGEYFRDRKGNEILNVNNWAFIPKNTLKVEEDEIIKLLVSYSIKKYPNDLNKGLDLIGIIQTQSKIYLDTYFSKN